MSNPIVLSKVLTPETKLPPQHKAGYPKSFPGILEPADEARNIVNVYTIAGLMPPAERERNYMKILTQIHDLFSSKADKYTRIEPVVAINFVDGFGPIDLVKRVNNAFRHIGGIISLEGIDILDYFPNELLNKRSTGGQNIDNGTVVGHKLTKNSGENKIVPNAQKMKFNFEDMYGAVEGENMLSFSDYILLQALRAYKKHRFIDQSDGGDSQSTVFLQYGTRLYPDKKYALRALINHEGKVQVSTHTGHPSQDHYIRSLI
ncbi:hypothetical protein IPO96_01885 [Candidatus Saccharibacteria bacterium]|nr:MAG: hypothetical protein IPO96_01885 [Candidatus Saccharibacteria bacterium]